MQQFESRIGAKIRDRYTIINVIGEGEDSVVYGVYDTLEERTAALKMLRPEKNSDGAVVERFCTEVDLLSSLSHPNIVSVYETCLEADCKYFTMEYIEGITLKKHIASKGALDTEEILFLSRQILSALEEVHKKGIVHSDIKPQNIVILPDGQVRLMDFGISKRNGPRKPLAEVDPDDPTFGGIFSDDPISDEDQPSDFAVGSVHYVSPEQAEGRELDHLSDIYSFGVVLYEITTGILPFFGESAQKIATMHVRLQPVPPTRLDPSIPEGLEKIILRAMEKIPEARFSSAAEMEMAMETLAKELHTPANEEPTTAEPLSPWERVKKLATEYLQEFSIPSLVTGVLCALLITIVIGLGILSERLIHERNDPSHVRIPDLVGKDFLSASAALDDDVYDFDIRYVTSDSHQGRVIEQSPGGGAIRKWEDGESCVIRVTVACRTLPPVMPDISHMDLRDVQEYLSAYDSTVTIVEQPHAYFPAGEIISTYPEAGQPTVHDITLYVSAGWTE